MDRRIDSSAVLCAHLDRSVLRFSEALQPLKVATPNEIFRFRLEDAASFDQPLVLRLTHDERDTAREGIIEDGVAEQGFRAPPVLLRGGSSSASGGRSSSRSSRPAFPSTRRSRRAPRSVPSDDSRPAGRDDVGPVPTDDITACLAAEGWEPDRLDSLAVLADVDEHAAQPDRSDLRQRRGGAQEPTCVRSPRRVPR